MTASVYIIITVIKKEGETMRQQRILLVRYVSKYDQNYNGSNDTIGSLPAMRLLPMSYLEKRFATGTLTWRPSR